MTINDGVIILDEPISDEMAEEFFMAINQGGIHKVIIEDSQIGASIMQILFCFSKSNTVECKDEFLNGFFNNITYYGESA